MQQDLFDVLVVGGGINGAGTARDLAGRGHRVLLVERDDWAAHTSSASTKLIHGGLRYLEQHALGLVRKSLQERARLLERNPHLMQPLRLILPHDASQRPRWLLRAGLFLYDHLAPRGELPASATLTLPDSAWGEPLRPGLQHAFAYSDVWVDDARLVLACVLDARRLGATAWSRCTLISARRLPAMGTAQAAQPPVWEALLRHADGREHTVHARALVNAAGPWAGEVLARAQEAAQATQAPRLRWVQGTHIVIAQRWQHPGGYLLQNDDGRVMFALPFAEHTTLLGTTDCEIQAPAQGAQATEGEVDYLCRQASRWLREPVRREHILHRFAGIRPLVDDASQSASSITRDYRLTADAPAGLAPRLDLWGGKLTTFRLQAEQAANCVSPWLGPSRPAWTAQAALPGGDCGPLDAWVATLQRRHPQRDPVLLRRWAMAYGSAAQTLLSQPSGREVLPGLWEVELRHWMTHEDARTVQDMLWRRSKLLLRYPAAEQSTLQAWLDAETGNR
jgi:glycerol-3-phosphate dehydrogenase